MLLVDYLKTLSVGKSSSTTKSGVSKPSTSNSGVPSHTLSAVSLRDFSMINFFLTPDCTEESFDLGDLAACYDVDITEKNHNEVAHAIIEKIVCKSSEREKIHVPGDLRVVKEPAYVFNGQSANQLCRFLISKKNRGDVGIYLNNPQTNLCIIEVHSSPFVTTIRKVAVGIIEILRVVKAHGITECTLTGFAFPKLDVNQCVVKVTVSYIPVNIQFNTKCITVAKENFQNELISAINNNFQLLSKCKEKKILDTAEKYYSTES